MHQRRHHCLQKRRAFFCFGQVSVSLRLHIRNVDRVFRTDCTTREVYEKGAKEVAISVVDGLNASVFAYGQTSSGKTYTMSGITEFAIADIYDYIHKHPDREFVLKFSAMEIYNESVRDLLSADFTPLRLLDDPERGTIVEKLTEEVLTDWNHVTQLLSVCDAQRQIGETALNEMSSRSHQIIRLTIDSSSRQLLGRDSSSTLSATVNFVDLAGSERASQSLSAGTRLKEGCHINRSLLTLGTVIRKLSKGRNGHIPYRDSKLTRILQTSLGGNARTAIICTMSPAHSHVEQSRNTLLFASCAKEVATNAHVNVVMSDKALVKYLQRELARLESELRSPQSTSTPSNYQAILREKDLRIAKLEEEINDLILKKDIAQSQVRDLLQMLRDNANTATEVRSPHYPHLRVQRSPDIEIQEQESSFLADPYCSDGHSRTSSQDHIVRVPYFDGNYPHGDTSPRILINNSNSSECYSYNGWEEMDKQSNRSSEDLCREVRCIETEELSSVVAEQSKFSSHENTGFAEVSPMTPLHNNRHHQPFPMRDSAAETQDSIASVTMSLKESQQMTPLSFSVDKEEKELSSIHIPDISPLENDLMNRRLKLTRSRSCKASIANSSSPWFDTVNLLEKTPCLESEGMSLRFDRKQLPLTFDRKSLSGKEFHPSPGNAHDISIDTSIPEFTNDTREKFELPTEPSFIESPSKDIELKKNVKDIGLDPIEDESESHSSWTVEFKRLQREIIELWHACNASMVHRTYFFMLFQGDPSDAIYLEVELRRMRFLKDKFSRGDKTIVSGRCVTLESSGRSLVEERRMLSRRMSKKLSEQERERLFLKWGIGLNSKYRRMQLAHRLWTKTEDMEHIAESAFLVAKLIGIVVPDKEMFGLNFTPRCSTRLHSFRRSLVALL
ncbi:kinesin-like protein KIN-7E isoform X2 [Andrographis paniculata]|uniref:kinesin-like protein KIN-7E isoform X2 n=1 Tax=Andrographis paniculata TaxID=175694 RepID=UPI0021E7B9CB|nr:kinesin-like protein KIN-7E isoform X2 [Andrographis paniculata]